MANDNTLFKDKIRNLMSRSWETLHFPEANLQNKRIRYNNTQKCLCLLSRSAPVNTISHKKQTMFE